MPCTVYIYDVNGAVITSSKVLMYAENHKSKIVIANATNGTMSGGLYGATLSFGMGTFPYEVIVDDSTTPYPVYSPAYIYPLNGNAQGQLDVVLYSLSAPGSGTGTRPSTRQQIDSYIANQPWANEEKIAATMLVMTLSVSRGGLSSTLRPVQSRWEMRLETLGIASYLI